MSIKKSLTPQERAGVIADFAGNNFLEAARHFREIQDEALELFVFVAQLSGVSLRRAYALAAIHRTFYSLGIDHDYARLLLSEVSFTREEIRISGSKAILARTAADDLGNAMPTVLSFVRD